MIGIAVGAPSATDRIPDWRRALGATVPEVVHAPASTHLGPRCNNGVDPAKRLVAGWEIEAGRVTCWACRHAGGES